MAAAVRLVSERGTTDIPVTDLAEAAAGHGHRGGSAGAVVAGHDGPADAVRGRGDLGGIAPPVVLAGGLGQLAQVGTAVRDDPAGSRGALEVGPLGTALASAAARRGPVRVVTWAPASLPLNPGRI